MRSRGGWLCVRSIRGPEARADRGREWKRTAANRSLLSPIANSIACRHAVMRSTSLRIKSRKARTHVGKCESSTYDGFHGIDVLQRIPVKLTHSQHVESSCGILHEKVSE
jgi:hypothetical protein